MDLKEPPSKKGTSFNLRIFNNFLIWAKNMSMFLNLNRVKSMRTRPAAGWPRQLPGMALPLVSPGKAR